MAETENAPKTEGTAAPPTPTPTPAPAATPAPAPAPAASSSTPAPAPAPKPSDAPKPGKPGKPGKAGKAEPPPPGVDSLKDNMSTIALVLLIGAALALVIVFQVRKDRTYNDNAWTALADLRQKESSGTKGFDELLTKFKGSDAEPFIRITYAARLYEAGSREEIEQARAQLETVLKEHRGNAFLAERVTTQLERIKAELEDPRAQLPAKPASADAAGVDSATPFPLDLGDGHGPGDGHGH